MEGELMRIPYRKDVYDQSEAICNLYEEGISIKNICEKYSCSSDVIKRILRINDIKIRTKDHKSNTKKRIDVWSRAQEICDRYIDGENIYELSIAFDCSDGPIKAILKAGGVEIRPCGWVARQIIKENYAYKN